MFVVICIVNFSFYEIFLDFMKREMLLLWSFQDIHHFEKIWIGSIQIFQERYKKCKQIDLLYFLENQLRFHTLSSKGVIVETSPNFGVRKNNNA